jgi:hypothetical protein
MREHRHEDRDPGVAQRIAGLAMWRSIVSTEKIPANSSFGASA